MKLNEALKGSAGARKGGLTRKTYLANMRSPDFEKSPVFEIVEDGKRDRQVGSK